MLINWQNGSAKVIWARDWWPILRKSAWKRSRSVMESILLCSRLAEFVFNFSKPTKESSVPQRSSHHGPGMTGSFPGTLHQLVSLLCCRGRFLCYRDVMVMLLPCCLSEGFNHSNWLEIISAKLSRWDMMCASASPPSSSICTWRWHRWPGMKPLISGRNNITGVAWGAMKSIPTH